MPEARVKVHGHLKSWVSDCGGNDPSRGKWLNKTFSCTRHRFRKGEVLRANQSSWFSLSVFKWYCALTLNQVRQHITLLYVKHDTPFSWAETSLNWWDYPQHNETTTFSLILKYRYLDREDRIFSLQYDGFLPKQIDRRVLYKIGSAWFQAKKYLYGWKLLAMYPTDLSITQRTIGLLRVVFYYWTI